jgi:HEPN domain-containing protein
MNKNIVTESYDSLYYMGEGDVLTTFSILKDGDLNDDIKFRNVIYHSSQAVEKYLKDYLVKNNIEVNKIHKMDILYNMVIENDNLFKTLEDDLLYINRFGPNVKYDRSIKIDGNTVKMVIKKLENIYNFKLIKDIREELRKKNTDFPSKSDIIFDISNYNISPVIAVRNAVDNIK